MGFYRQAAELGNIAVYTTKLAERVTTREIQVTCYPAESHDTIHLPLSRKRWPEGQSMYCRDPLGCHRIGSARGHDHMWYEYAEGG